jgi:hypothetical protein
LGFPPFPLICAATNFTVEERGKAEEVEEEGKRKAPTGVGAGRRRAEDDAVDAIADWGLRGNTLEQEPVRLRNATRELYAIVASSSSSLPAGEERMRRHREKLHQVVALIVHFISSWTPSLRRQQHATLPGAEGAHHLLDVMPGHQAALSLHPLHRAWHNHEQRLACTTPSHHGLERPALPWTSTRPMVSPQPSIFLAL